MEFLWYSRELSLYKVNYIHEGCLLKKSIAGVVCVGRHDSVQSVARRPPVVVCVCVCTFQSLYNMYVIVWGAL